VPLLPYNPRLPKTALARFKSRRKRRAIASINKQGRQAARKSEDLGRVAMTYEPPACPPSRSTPTTGCARPHAAQISPPRLPKPNPRVPTPNPLVPTATLPVPTPTSPVLTATPHVLTPTPHVLMPTPSVLAPTPRVPTATPCVLTPTPRVPTPFQHVPMGILCMLLRLYYCGMQSSATDTGQNHPR